MSKIDKYVEAQKAHKEVSDTLVLYREGDQSKSRTRALAYIDSGTNKVEPRVYFANGVTFEEAKKMYEWLGDVFEFTNNALAQPAKEEAAADEDVVVEE